MNRFTTKCRYGGIWQTRQAQNLVPIGSVGSNPTSGIRSIIFQKFARTILYHGMKEQILKLRKDGKTYNEIISLLGCSKGLVSYYCGNGQKEKTRNRQRSNRKENCLLAKVDKFRNRDASKRNRKQENVSSNPQKLIRHKADDFQRREGGGKLGARHIDFTYKDVIDKFGENTICYLTGRPIDLKQPRTYTFDHKVPASKGGDNTLENLGIACREANSAKADLLLPELLKLCEDMLIHNGYKVIRE